MARSQIAVTQVDRDGESPGTPTVSDHVNGHYFENNGRTWLEVTSTDASDQTLGFALLAALAANVDGVVIGDKEITIPAGSVTLMGPFPNTYYNQPGGSHVFVNPSVSTTLSILGFSL